MIMTKAICQFQRMGGASSRQKKSPELSELEARCRGLTAQVNELKAMVDDPDKIKLPPPEVMICELLQKWPLDNMPQEEVAARGQQISKLFMRMCTEQYNISEMFYTHTFKSTAQEVQTLVMAISMLFQTTGGKTSHDIPTIDPELASW